MQLIYAAEIDFPQKKAKSIQIINTCHALAKSGCEVFLLIQRGGCRSEKIPEFYGLAPLSNLHFYQLPALRSDTIPGVRWSWRELFFLSCLLVILRLKFISKPAAVFLRDERLAQFLLRFKPLINIPVIYEVHEVQTSKKMIEPGEQKALPSIRNMEKSICTKADRLITITGGIKHILFTEFPTSVPIEVIPDGVASSNINFSSCKPAALVDKPPDTKLIMYVGHIYRWKGVDGLIQAMKHVDGVRLVIVGGIPGSEDLSRLSNLVAKEGLTQKVVIKEFIPPQQVKEFLIQADVLVIPSSQDIRSRIFTSPLKLFEYMAAAKPIVACAVPSIMEILRDGVNAILVTPGDPAAMAKGIEKALRDSELARKIGEQAYRDVQDYSWEKRAEKIIRLAESIHESNAAVPKSCR